MEGKGEKNIFGKDVFFRDGIKDYNHLTIGELKKLVINDSGYIRSRALIELAKREEFELVLIELAKVENQKLISLFNLSVAQVGALGIIDFGDLKDINKLKIEIKKWSVKYQLEDFIDFLKRHSIDISSI